MPRTIRDIKIPQRRKSQPVSSLEKNSYEHRVHEPPIFHTPKTSTSRPFKSTPRQQVKFPRWIWWGLILVMVIFILMTRWGRAHVMITPYTVTAEVSQTLTLKREPGDGDAKLSVMIIQESSSETVPATNTRPVEQKASGTITIFNEESTAQRFREETRFETPDGLVFKLPSGEGVTVPAKKGATPGQVNVTVFAEKAGEEYNIAPTDFVIPGWREIKSPKFQTQYARSTTNMKGGFQGLEADIDVAVEDERRSSLQDSLESYLRELATSQTTSEVLMIPDSVRVQFADPQEQINPDQGTAVITESGKLSAVVIDTRNIAQLLAQKLLSDQDRVSDSDIVISNWQDLQLISSTPTIYDPNSINDIRLTIEGTVTFEWRVDTDRIIQSLVGQKKNQADQLLSEIEIEHIDISMWPIWRSKLPDQARRINVEIIQK